MHLLKSRLLKEGHGLSAAPTHLAVHHDLAARVEFVHPLRQIVQRNQVSANIADLVFVRLAHIEHEQVFFRVQAPLQIFHLNLGNTVAHRLLLSTNAAKLVVVYQLRDCRMRTADGAVGILPQLQLAEFHSQRVDQQQSSDERIAYA